MHFGDLDAATVQTAILGAHEKSTLLSDLINRLRSSAPPAWPLLEGTVEADSLILGPLTLTNASVALRLQSTGAEITGLDAKVLGGNMHGTGKIVAGDKPAYTLEGDFEKLNPVAVGQLLGEKWRGGAFDANGKIDLTGYTGADLASSAKGTLLFEWRHGVVDGSAPKQLARFDRWTADATIGNGKIALARNEVAQGSRKQAVEASVTLAEPAKISFSAPAKAALPKKP
jgi:hypothetical protein